MKRLLAVRFVGVILADTLVMPILVGETIAIEDSAADDV